jgi:hypothetical protein
MIAGLLKSDISMVDLVKKFVDVAYPILGKMK